MDLNKYIALSALGLMAILSLVGCGSAPKLAVPMPPAPLVERTAEPSVKVKTNGQLAQTLQNFKHALAQCNLDKDTIRVYIEAVSKPQSQN